MDDCTTPNPEGAQCGRGHFLTLVPPVAGGGWTGALPNLSSAYWGGVDEDTS